MKRQAQETDALQQKKSVSIFVPEVTACMLAAWRRVAGWVCSELLQALGGFSIDRVVTPFNTAVHAEVSTQPVLVGMSPLVGMPSCTSSKLAATCLEKQYMPRHMCYTSLCLNVPTECPLSVHPIPSYTKQYNTQSAAVLIPNDSLSKQKQRTVLVTAGGHRGFLAIYWGRGRPHVYVMGGPTTTGERFVKPPFATGGAVPTWRPSMGPLFSPMCRV